MVGMLILLVYALFGFRVYIPILKVNENLRTCQIS